MWYLIPFTRVPLSKLSFWNGELIPPMIPNPNRMPRVMAANPISPRIAKTQIGQTGLELVS